MEIEDLICQLSSPIFRFRMNQRNNPRGHAKVREEALAEVDRIVSEYCAGKTRKGEHARSRDVRQDHNSR